MTGKAFRYRNVSVSVVCMPGRTRSLPHRRRKGFIVLADNGRLLAELLEVCDVKPTLRHRAKFLGVGPATIHRAFDGGFVSTELIWAVRTKFPHVQYERLFTEVTDDAAAATPRAA